MTDLDKEHLTDVVERVIQRYTDWSGLDCTGRLATLIANAVEAEFVLVAYKDGGS